MKYGEVTSEMNIWGNIEDDHVDTSVVVANVINQSWNEGTQLLNLRPHSGYLCGFGPPVLGHLVGP